MQNAVTNRSFSDFNWGPGHANGHLIGGGPYIFSWLNYVSTLIEAQDVEGWAISGHLNDSHWRFRKVAMWGCYTANRSMAAGGAYSGWDRAFGIRDTATQLNSFMWKNAGLFFGDELAAGPYGSSQTIYQVADFLDFIWVCGMFPYPGACDPTYSFQKACLVTAGTYPELGTAKPVGIGYPYLPSLSSG